MQKFKLNIKALKDEAKKRSQGKLKPIIVKGKKSGCKGCGKQPKNTKTKTLTEKVSVFIWHIKLVKQDLIQNGKSSFSSENGSSLLVSC